MSATASNIVLKAYDLLKHSIPILKKLPREQKFLLGDRIQNKISDLLELLVETYYSPRPQKPALLAKVNITLETLRYYVRLLYELGYYNSTTYGQLAERINELGKMCGGWLKSLQR